MTSSLSSLISGMEGVVVGVAEGVDVCDEVRLGIGVTVGEEVETLVGELVGVRGGGVVDTAVGVGLLVGV